MLTVLCTKFIVKSNSSALASLSSTEMHQTESVAVER